MRLHMSIVAAAAALMASGPLAAATVVASSARGAYVNLSVASVAMAGASLGAVSGTESGGYDRGSTLGASAQTWTLVDGLVTDAYEGLSIGAATTRASGSAGAASSASASATVTGARSTLSTATGLATLVGLTFGADTLTSTTIASQAADGRYTASGTSTITGLVLGGALLDGLAIDLSTLASAAPNTVAVLLPGLRLTFNEQLSTYDTSGIGYQTNAMHLSLSDYLYGGRRISGDVILGQSEARVGAVPEPGTWAMMLIGFGLVGSMMRRARREDSPAAT